MAKRKSSNPRYEGERITNLAAVRGRATRFVYWYNPRVGVQKTDVACSFQVFIRNCWTELCRYDSYHQVFHRHAPGWPAPKGRDVTFPDVPISERGAVALDDILAHMEQWVSLIPQEEIDESAS